MFFLFGALSTSTSTHQRETHQIWSSTWLVLFFTRFTFLTWDIWLQSRSLLASTQICCGLLTERIKVTGGSWVVLAASGRGSTSTLSLRGGGEADTASSCLSVCSVHAATTTPANCITFESPPQLAFHIQDFYLVVDSCPSFTLHPIFSLWPNARGWPALIFGWITPHLLDNVWFHCVSRFNINKTYPEGKTAALNVKSVFTSTKEWLMFPRWLLVPSLRLETFQFVHNYFLLDSVYSLKRPNY